ncbi:arylsulfatase J-like, partial [Drosophila novamexicana]|uniref:arylsulfatase J-like n=1 Tax=Drosophila novamexicana TaxID=47314 RepID=UPI0011E59DFC
TANNNNSSGDEEAASHNGFSNSAEIGGNDVENSGIANEENDEVPVCDLGGNTQHNIEVANADPNADAGNAPHNIKVANAEPNIDKGSTVNENVNNAPNSSVFQQNYEDMERMQKESPWEGGIRSAGAIWSPLLQKSSYVSEQVIHAIDWLPTLASAAGVALPDHLNIDGVNMWPSLSENLEPQPRTLLHVLDDVFGYSSYMRDNLKYVNGSRFEGRFDSWLGELDAGEIDPLSAYYVQQVLSSEVQQVLGSKSLTSERIKQLRAQATHHCSINGTIHLQPLYLCHPLQAPCYFNLTDDPCEHYNLANLYPLQLQQLEKEVNEFRLGAVESARVPIPDLRANPALHENFWEWWNDTETETVTSGAEKWRANLLNLIGLYCALYFDFAFK